MIPKSKVSPFRPTNSASCNFDTRISGGRRVSLYSEDENSATVSAANAFLEISAAIFRQSGYAKGRHRNLLKSNSSIGVASSTSSSNHIPLPNQRPKVKNHVTHPILKQRVSAISSGSEKSEKWRTGLEPTVVPTETTALLGKRMGKSAEDESVDATKEETRGRCHLKRRRKLVAKRIKLVDLSVVFALIGAVLAVLNGEMTVKSYRDGEMISMLESGADDWRVMLTPAKIIQICVEIVICSVCPLPVSTTFFWQYLNSDKQSYHMVEVPLAAVLSVPMFLRSYLFCRFICIHSRQYQDAATRSIAALNNTAVNFQFVMKTFMAKSPLKVILLFAVSYWCTISWVLTQCERYGSKSIWYSDEHTYCNWFWFIIVTFLSIGYGDVVPNTYCGRTIAVMTGIVGAMVSSTLIAVIIRKLELTSAEKHVNNFMADSRLHRERKKAAATVLQHTWFIHKFKILQDSAKVREHQRKFLAAISKQVLQKMLMKIKKSRH